MSTRAAPGAPWWRRASASRRRAGLAAAAAALALGAQVRAQTWTGSPPVAPDLQAALTQADAGSPQALTGLADSGRPDAQFYAAVMLLTGRGGTPKDPVRGCAYAERASPARADAMHLLGSCRRLGLDGKPDAAKAKAAYARAAEMGYPKSKCALGEMLMAEPAEAGRGLALCREAAQAGDVDAQLAVADAYFSGRGAPADRREARRWYELAAKQNSPQGARRLGEMYAAGDGGPRDSGKALELWRRAETAGDPLACILVADALFADLTGGRKPEAGTYAFKGGVPVADIEVIESWYQEALKRDPRPDVKARAQYALGVLERFRQAGEAAAKVR